jgi:hypothetical protein
MPVLKRLGITAGMVETDHRDERRTYISDDLEPLLANDLRCYLENIATDLYSPYHKWSGNFPVNWRFIEVKKRFLGKSPRSFGADSRAEPDRPRLVAKGPRSSHP